MKHNSNHFGSKKRLTIGFITSGIGNTVSTNLWVGVLDAARQLDVNLLCFVGESLQSPHGFKSLANVLYELVSPYNVDGLLFWNSALSNYVQEEDFRAFRERFHPLLMVDVEEPHEDLTESYSYQGMHTAIAHLIDIHNRRRIAFIRGPEGNSEAEYRYQAYCHVLRDRQISFDPALVTPPGRWKGAWAAEAVELLMTQRNASFDGLAAPSDVLAVNAIGTLQKKGVRVPQDVAVVGIDDSLEGRCSTPSLTTMPYSLYTIGQEGLHRLVNAIIGSGHAPEHTWPIKLKIRRSCGCLPPSIAQASVGISPVTNTTLAAVLANRRSSLLTEMEQVFQGSTPAIVWCEHLIDAFSAAFEHADPNEFLETLDEVLCQTIVAGHDVAAWQTAISLLSREIAPALHSRELVLRAENLWQQARVMIGEATQRTQGYQKLQEDVQTQIVRQISARLISTFDVMKLMDVLAEELPRLKIASCYVALYDDPDAPTDRARLILAYHDHERIVFGADGHHFPSRHLVPKEFLPQGRRYSMVVMPLYFDSHLGFALFEAGPREGNVYGVLSGQISSALQGALLVERVQDHADEIARYRDGLEDLVQERTAALERVNVLLRDEIREHARAEQALRTSEQQYRLLAENVKDGIVIVQSGIIRVANSVLTTMLDTSLDDVLMSDPVTLFRSPFRERARQCLEDVSLESCRWQAEMPTQQGRVLWVEIEQTRIVWNSQPAVLLTIRDATERKRREQQLEEERARLEQENLHLKSTIKERYRFGRLIGKSLAMQRVYELIISAATSDVNVLLMGESGTGKELIARTLHQSGPRRAQKFVSVNCASIPETLFEREFFGHRKGAFTGADRDKPGLFDQAHRGTLFLDEVTELTPGMQAKLLRVLQDGEYLPLGSPVPKQTNVAIIAATNKDYRTEIEQGRLRKDFFYRIAVIEITVPPLRERKDDLPLLIEHLLGQYREKQIEMYGQAGPNMPLDTTGLPGELVQTLYSYDWPGNVRELQNVLQRYLATGEVSSVPNRLMTREPSQSRTLPASPNIHVPLPEALKAFEKQRILDMLALMQYNTRKTAKLLGIPLTTLYYKIKYYHLKDGENT